MAFSNWISPNLVRFNSTVSSDVLNFLENSWDKNIQENVHKSSKTFAPSSLRCERISWFRLRGVEPDVSEVSDKNLDFVATVGTACHRKLQSILVASLGTDWINVDSYLSSVYPSGSYSSNSDGYETQIEFYSPPIRFACDGLIRWNSKIYLLEIKSCEYSTFQELSDPRSEHIAQVTSYCAMLHIQDVIFIYIDRQYGTLKCFEYHVPKYAIDSTFDMFDRVQDCVKSHIAPPGLPVGDKWCSPSMCKYFQKCKEYGR